MMLNAGYSVTFRLFFFAKWIITFLKFIERSNSHSIDRSDSDKSFIVQLLIVDNFSRLLIWKTILTPILLMFYWNNKNL